jgi:hypothetical protein
MTVKLLGDKGSIELISFSLEVYEKKGQPRAVFTNHRPVGVVTLQQILSDLHSYYGKDLYLGSWVPYNSAKFPHLPDPSFDPAWGIWVNECDGFMEIEE